MKKLIGLPLSLSLCALLACTTAQAEPTHPITEVELPLTSVIAVKTADTNPSAYAEAFGKLVGYYAKPSTGVKVVFPQQSITIHNEHYAAIGTKNAVTNTPPDIQSMELPACRFLSQSYTGNYEGIRVVVEGLVDAALSRKLHINPACGIRIHHLNSPDDTPVDELKHMVYMPVS